MLSYRDRVEQRKSTTSETRRVRGDQIEVFQIAHITYEINSIIIHNNKPTFSLSCCCHAGRRVGRRCDGDVAEVTRVVVAMGRDKMVLVRNAEERRRTELRLLQERQDAILQKRK